MKNFLKWLHKDTRASDLVEYTLILAAVALPLLAVIIWFWKDISGWIGEVYQGIRSGTVETDPKTLGH
jgi:Flp pilus assembly pilin Flp